MSFYLVLIALIGLTIAGFYLGRSCAMKSADGNARVLHSRPHYYGYFIALWCGLPAILVLTVWTTMQTPIVESIVQSGLPASMTSDDPSRMSLVMNDVRNLASGNITSGEITGDVREAADRYNSLIAIGELARSRGHPIDWHRSDCILPNTDFTQLQGAQSG